MKYPKFEADNAVAWLCVCECMLLSVTRMTSQMLRTHYSTIFPHPNTNASRSNFK